MQSRAQVAYAPQSTSTEDFPAIAAAPPALLALLDDAPAYRPRLPRSPRGDAAEQLVALVVATDFGVPWDSSQSIARASYAPANDSGDVLLALVGGTPDPDPGTLWNGVPWNSSQSLARASYAPANQCDDVLLELVPQALPFGPWLDTPPAVSRYTIITPEQEDAAELPAIAPPGPYFDMSEPWARGKVVRSELLRLVRVHDDALPGIAFETVFVAAGPGRIIYITPAFRTIRVPVEEDDLIRPFEPKPPQEIDSINFDYTARLAARGDSIAAIQSVEVVDSDDDDLALTDLAHANGVVSAEWSGGTLDTGYTIECIVTTVAGRTWPVRATVFIAY
jgi:hypothetical protein